MKFPVRVRPVEGESFIGYSLRVAKTNGWSTHKDVLNIVGVPTRLKRMLSDYHEVCTVASGLEPWLLVEPGEIAQHFTDQYLQGWLYSDNRLIRNIRVLQPRICPFCISSVGGYLKYDWALLPVTHCEEHQYPLIDQCPECHSPFKWTTGLFEGCERCGLTWKEVGHSKAPTPSWQANFMSARKEAMEVSRFLEGFTERVVKAARPYDCFHEQLDTLHESVTSIGKLVAQAYEESRAVNEWPPKGFVKARRLKHLDSIQYHCQHKHMLSALGLTPADRFSALIERGVIEPIYDTPVLRDMIFDIRDSQVLISKCKRSLRLPNSHTLIDANSEILGRFDTAYGELVAAALVEDTLSIPNDANDFSVSFVPSDWLDVFLRDNLNKNCVGDISLYRACRILGKSPLEIDHMVSKGILVAGRLSGQQKSVVSEGVLMIIDGLKTR